MKTKISNGLITMDCWLIFNQAGVVRMSKTPPALKPLERAIQVVLDVSVTVFSQPLLKANIVVDHIGPQVTKVQLVIE